MDRREFMQLSAGSLALAALGCRRPSTDRDSTLTVAWSGGEQMVWLFTDDSTMFLVFLPLVARNADGELEGRLAERWEHSPDYRIWTVHLRQGVRWHDGVPVTAHDIKFTLDLLSDPDVLYAQPGGYAVTVLDDATYTIEYHHLLADEVGKGSPLDDYTVYYPKHLVQQLVPVPYDPERDFGNWEWWSHPVGNGPYRFVRHLPQTMMEFEANPDYYRGKPSIERVVVKFTSSDVTELLSGNVDAVNFVARESLLPLSEDDRFRAYHSSNPRHNRVIAWNLRNELFRDASVRRALTLALDRVELHQVLHMPAGIPIFDVPLSGGQYRRGEVPDPLPYDPERARQLLQEAGWRDSDGDGVRERDGRPFRFTLLTPSGWRGRLGEAAYIQSQLRLVGIDVQVQTMDFFLVLERVTGSQFEAALFIANASLDSPMGVLPFFGEESFIGYANRDVISLLNELQSAVGPDEIDRIHRQLAPIFEADLPATFLYPAIDTSVASRRVRGLSTPFRADPLRYIDELWLEGEP
jgi:peptide/nickel transport system substrate-binding protein